MSAPRSASDLMPKLTENILGKRGMLFGKMLASWPQIVGAEIAALAQPIDLKFGGKADKKTQATLHLGVSASAALEISYQKSLLLERVNLFFGYPAVRDIKLIQQTNFTNKNKAAAPPPRPLTQAQEKNLDEMLVKVGENELQTALKNLGRAILSRQQ